MASRRSIRTVPRNYAFEATGFYQGASLFGASEFGAMWQVNIGLQKTLRSGGKITLAVSDVFDSYEWKVTTGAPSDPLYINARIDFSHPTVMLTYSTRFGSGKSASKRSTASEDERRRVQ